MDEPSRHVAREILDADLPTPMAIAREAERLTEGEALSKKATAMMQSTEALLAAGLRLTEAVGTRAAVYAKRPGNHLAVVGDAEVAAGTVWHEWYEQVGRAAVAHMAACETMEEALETWFAHHGVMIPELNIDA